jgi:hypothetical protein
LFDFKNADDTADDNGARKGRAVVDSHHVERISVIGLCRWATPQSWDQERLAQDKGFQLRIIGEFDVASSRGFDDDLQIAIVREQRRLKKFGIVLQPQRDSGFDTSEFQL